MCLFLIRELNLILFFSYLESHQLEPKGIVLTHAHRDHTGAVRRLMRLSDARITLYYHQQGYRHPFRKKADKWLAEGDLLSLGRITLHVLETAGHSPGGISLYTTDVRTFRGVHYDGVVFTGDLIFRRSLGRTDITGGEKQLLFDNIRSKLMYHPPLSDNFLILAGHLGITTIGEEKRKIRRQRLS